eukprot:sb/3469493/
MLGIPNNIVPIDTTTGALIGFTWFRKYEEEEEGLRIKRGKKKVFLACVVAILVLQGGYYYNNATMTIEGVQVPLRDVAVEFFNSPAWVETKLKLAQFYEEVWEIGFLPALSRLNLFSDETMSEEAAFELLGVEANITSTALKKKFRKLSLEYHPDKHPPETREKANAKFMELKTAYDVIMKIRSYRTKIESAKVLKEMADRLNRFEERYKKSKEKKKEEKKEDEKTEL